MSEKNIDFSHDVSSLQGCSHHEKTKIIVRMPNWIGDAVMALPVLEDIKAWNKHAEVFILGHLSICELVKESPFVDGVIAFSKKEKNVPKIIADLKHHKFDIGLLTTNSFSSAWWFWKAKIPVRIGYSMHFRRLLLTHPACRPKNSEQVHEVEMYKALLNPITGQSSSLTRPTLYVSAQEKKQAWATLEAYGVSDTHRIIGINPGAAFGPAKCWPKERFIALTHRLIEDMRCRVLYFGDQDTKTLVDDIVRHFPPRVVNLAGKTTLRQFIALVDTSSAFVTNDSGPMHIAAALRKPLVAIFGSTNEVKTGPYKWGSVIHKHVSCSPCYRRVCPIDFRCMMQISVDEVYEETIRCFHE